MDIVQSLIRLFKKSLVLSYPNRSRYTMEKMGNWKVKLRVYEDPKQQLRINLYSDEGEVLFLDEEQIPDVALKEGLCLLHVVKKGDV